MTKQPEALYLADKMTTIGSTYVPEDVAACLRRQHAENEALLEANRLLDAALLKSWPNGCNSGEVFDLWNAARAAIAAAMIGEKK